MPPDGATSSPSNGSVSEPAPVFVDRVLMFTDIEGSSVRWDDDPEVMRHLMRHHDAAVTTAVERQGGIVGARTGDGAIALFESSTAAAAAALALQVALDDGPRESGVGGAPLKVRIGLHRGVVEARDGEHYGPAMHRTARIMGAAHGGQIVLSAMVASELSVGATGVYVMIDHGVHQLKGFHEPETLTQLVAVGANVDRRGLRGATERVSLPQVDTTAFVGRDDDLEHVMSQLDPGRIVTLLGTGGVGKTRLAVQAAWLTLPQMGDGCWFVDLAAASSPDRVVPLVADALGIADDGPGGFVEAIRQAMQARRMLVVLDNCEHVITAAAALVRGVCSSAMAATVLATSQRSLDVPGEYCVPIGPLDVEPGERDGTDEGGESPAGRLFILAARRADPGFVVDRAARAAISRVCRRLDGLPLALELAAARVRVMPVAQVADELQTGFGVLRSRDHPERHRTMSAAIGWSVGLLHDDDRSMLFDLSVFTSVFDWDAATAVSGRDRFDVADSLDELIRRSLLVRVGSNMRMLVPVRLYCAEQLAATGRATYVHECHARWVTATFGASIDDRDPAVVSERLDRTVDAAEDIATAHSWLIGTDPAAAASLAIALGDMWLSRARHGEALAQLRACDTDATPTPIRIDVLGWLSAFAWTIGAHDEGEAAARRAIDLARQHDLPLPTFAATRLAVRLTFSNRPDEAGEYAKATIAALRDGNGEPSRHLGPLGVVIAALGDMADGIALADKGIEAARPLGALRLLTALANRILLEPTSETVAILTAEAAELAAAVGRVSAQAHAVAALAHRARQHGDLHGFLHGVGRFADLLLADEPTSVIQMMQWVPGATMEALPRETAVMLAALESLAEQHNYQGTERERARRGDHADNLRTQLGDSVFDRAWAEGSALRLPETVDRLHWMTDALA